MRTVTQKEIERDFDRILNEVEDDQEGICIIADNGNKSLLLGNKAYQLYLQKNLSIREDNSSNSP